MRKIGFFFVLIWMLVLSACSPPQTPFTDQPVPETSTVEAELPNSSMPGAISDQVRNAPYQLGLLDQIQVVQLTDGRYEEGVPGSDDHILVSVTEYFARGDLNRDGENETIALVSETYGDAGTFVFLVVFEYQNNAPVFLTSVYLDDQPIVNELSVDQGEIFVEAITHARNDPICCPTLATKRHYLLNGVNLILMDYSTRTPAGEPRAITIEAPVNGAQVSGIVRLKGNVSVAPFENNLVYRIHDLGGVELTVGPINVEAPDLGAPGSFEKAVDLGNILTNTMVRITVEDINMADGSLFALDAVILQVR